MNRIPKALTLVAICVLTFCVCKFASSDACAPCLDIECDTKIFKAFYSSQACYCPGGTCITCTNWFLAEDKSDFCSIQPNYIEPPHPIHYCQPDGSGDSVFGEYQNFVCDCEFAFICYPQSEYNGYLNECNGDVGPFPCH